MLLRIWDGNCLAEISQSGLPEPRATMSTQTDPDVFLKIFNDTELEDCGEFLRVIAASDPETVERIDKIKFTQGKFLRLNGEEEVPQSEAGEETPTIKLGECFTIDQESFGARYALAIFRSIFLLQQAPGSLGFFLDISKKASF